MRRKREQPMPRYYGKNIAQNAQKKFFKRKTLETEKERRADFRDGRRFYETEKRTDEYERGEQDCL